MTKSEARKAAMDWLRASPLPWPAVHMFPQPRPVNLSGGRVVHVGYHSERGAFIEVVHLRFGPSGDLEFVKDLRQRKDKWPAERVEEAA